MTNTERTRHVMYSKRCYDLLKNTYELSVLSDIDCVLISFSPSGRLTHFSNHRNIEDVLIKFLGCTKANTLSRTPIPNKEELMLLLENLKTQDMAREASNKHGNSTSDLSKSCSGSEDINKEVIKLENKLNSLKNIQRYVGDLRKPIHSPLELKERNRKLVERLDQVMKRKNILLSKSETISTASTLPITTKLEQKLEALQLRQNGKHPMQPPNGGTTGVIMKEKVLDTNTHSFNTIDNNTHNSMDYVMLSKETNT